MTEPGAGAGSAAPLRSPRRAARCAASRRQAGRHHAPRTARRRADRPGSWRSGLARIALIGRSRGVRRQPRRPGGHVLGGNRVAAGIVACGVLICCTGLTGLAVASRLARGPAPLGPASRVAVPAGRLAALPDPGRQRQVARPATLVIPSIGVRTRLVRLGRTAAGTLQVPATTAVAGWYTGSPRPGEIGSSVIAGHVDSYRGPGVFFRLRLLHPGSLLYVRRTDGVIGVFRVISVRLYRKDHFPSAAVYGPAPQAELRLITCGGTFDHGLGSYLSNVVVYSVELPSRASSPARSRGGAMAR